MAEYEIVLSVGSNIPLARGNAAEDAVGKALEDAADSGASTHARLASQDLVQAVITRLGSQVQAASHIYTSAPWGGVEQPEFFNATVLVRTELAPLDFLHEMQAWELEFGRRRLQHWGPRTLDIDLIQVRSGGEEVTSTDPELLLPHPYAQQRAFVLLPWAEIEPDAELAGQPIVQLLAKLEEDSAQMKMLGA
ncbi:MAG: 2-amino-4-hydroxy-6-hydroxymethyldihydropteridine diphosphokinase [Corynebacterium sp.]|nr:2-amino-4-hydroxy-6-hydroxymethyldihydropteridine diphosphokinase [Corynebacterium sp.]